MKNEISRRDFLKGALFAGTAVVAGGGIKSILDGKIYVPYLSDNLEESDELHGILESISYEDLSKFYLLDYAQPLSGDSFTGLKSIPNLVTFLEKGENSYLKVCLKVNTETVSTEYVTDYGVLHDGESTTGSVWKKNEKPISIEYIREEGVRYSGKKVDSFYNGSNVNRFINVGEYLDELGMVKESYLPEDIVSIVNSYQSNWIRQEDGTIYANAPQDYDTNSRTR